MKTLSLKMLLVAALVVSPIVVKAEDKPAAQENTTTTTTVVTEAPKTEAPAAPAAPADKSVKTEDGYFTKAKNAVGGAAAAAIAFPSNVYAWATETKTNAVLATVVTYLAAKEAYAYLTAPAKTKTVKIS